MGSMHILSILIGFVLGYFAGRSGFLSGLLGRGA